MTIAGIGGGAGGLVVRWKRGVAGGDPSAGAATAADEVQA